MLYSIVIPCYKSSKTIRKVVEMTMQEMDRLDRREYEFVLVDDCSPDDGETMAALMGLVRDYACVKVVELAKNAGQHNAVMAGLNEGSGEYLSPWMMICRHIRPSWGNYWMNLIRDMILYMDIMNIRSTASSVTLAVM